MPKRMSVGNGGSLFLYSEEELKTIKSNKETERLAEQNAMLMEQNKEILEKLNLLLQDKDE